ncbi:MAG: type II toxin-antitoxin system prevent-host-death family antitoxin [Desulfoferrobacter sp.]
MGSSTMNIAEAKKHLSEILGRVAYGNEQIIITKRGKPMAKLVPMETSEPHLADVKGWLEETDEFFTVLKCIVSERENHTPRIMREHHDQ